MLSQTLRRLRDPRAAGALVVVAALVVRTAFVTVNGYVHASDTETYLASCARLAADPAGAMTGVVGLEYLAFLLPFCTVHAVGGVGAWLAAQVVLSSVAALLSYRIGLRLGGPSTGLLAGLGFAGLYEIFRWDAYALSDSTFVLYLLLALAAFLRWRAAATPRSTAVLAATLLLVAFCRPTGIPVALGWVALALLSSGVPSAARRAAAAGGAVVAGLWLVVAAGPKFGYYTEKILVNSAAGVVINDDPTFDWPRPVDAGPVATAAHFVGLALARMAALWLPLVPRFSTAHILLNVVTLVPLFALGALGLARLARRSRFEAAALAVPIVSVLVIAALVPLDFDWRYRNPALPSLLLLAAYVLGPLLDRFAQDGGRRDGAEAGV